MQPWPAPYSAVGAPKIPIWGQSLTSGVQAQLEAPSPVTNVSATCPPESGKWLSSGQRGPPHGGFFVAPKSVSPRSSPYRSQRVHHDARQDAGRLADGFILRRRRPKRARPTASSPSLEQLVAPRRRRGTIFCCAARWWHGSHSRNRQPPPAAGLDTNQLRIMSSPSP